MSSRKETERIKYIQEKCQTLLNQMLRDEDNKYCVDCDAKGPRWASWNLGIFLCIRCAGIHRNLGVHISRVKSVNLDSWTPEQVVSLQQMGNSRARAVYEAQLPDGFKRPQTDHTLESFIRAKYEHKRYLAKEWVPPPAPKVNWDKEIDDEIERQKRKKKSSTNSTSLSIASPVANDNKKSSSNINKTPIPAPLPKPKANTNSPKITLRTEPAPAAATVTLDLLGLSSPTTTGPSSGNRLIQNNFTDLNNDTFSNFLSGPPAPQTTATVLLNATPAAGSKANTSNLELLNETNDNSLAKEEADFFNQIPNEKEKAKMTKDSILALYGNGPTNTLGGGFNAFNSAPLPTQTGYVGAPAFNAQFGQNNMGIGGLLGQTGTTMPQQFIVGQPQTTVNGGLLGGFNILGQSQQPQQQQHLPQIQSLLNQSTSSIVGGTSCPFSGIGNHQISTAGPQINGTFAHFPPQTNNFAQSHQQTTNPTANINQQFGNLNLGNVWQ